MPHLRSAHSPESTSSSFPSGLLFAGFYSCQGRAPLSRKEALLHAHQCAWCQDWMGKVAQQPQPRRATQHSGYAVAAR